MLRYKDTFCGESVLDTCACTLLPITTRRLRQSISQLLALAADTNSELLTNHFQSTIVPAAERYIQ